MKLITDKEEVQKNLPYFVVGSSSMPTPRLSYVFTAEGIKELAKRTKKGDMVRVESWSDVSDECESKKHYGRVTIIRK